MVVLRPMPAPPGGSMLAAPKANSDKQQMVSLKLAHLMINEDVGRHKNSDKEYD